MRTFRRKIIIHLVIASIKAITILKRGVFFFFSTLTISLIGFGSAIFKTTILPFYKFYLPIKKRIRIFSGESSKNKFFFLLSHPKSINLLIILMALFVAITNIKAHDKEQSATQKAPLFILLGAEEEITAMNNAAVRMSLRCL